MGTRVPPYSLRCSHGRQLKNVLLAGRGPHVNAQSSGRAGARSAHRQCRRARRDSNLDQCRAVELRNAENISALIGGFRSSASGHAENVAGVAALLASADVGSVTESIYFVDGSLTWHYEEQSGSGAGYQSATPSA